MLGGNKSKAGLRFDTIHNPIGGRIRENTSPGNRYRRLDNSTYMSRASIDTCTNCDRENCNGRCDKILAIEKANVDPRKRALGEGSGFKGIAKYEYDGQMMTATDLANMAGISLPTFFKRLQKGWTIKEAAETPRGYHRRKI